MKKILIFIILIPSISLSQQQSLEIINYDDNEREYIIYVPQSYSIDIPTPLLLAFHGGSGYADDFMNNEADFRSIADTSGFILIYPQALEDPNDDNSTNWLHKEPTDHKDVFFIEALIEEITAQYNIDSERIYACGYSLGGMFSYELACQLNHKVAAISSVAGAIFQGAFQYCEIFHPTAVQSINGTEDDIHPYNDQNGWGYFSVAAIDSFWSTSNNTDLTPIITQVPDINVMDGSQVERHTWINGDGCVSVEELKIIGGGHDWPSPLSSWGNQDINATAEVWNFVSKFNMDGLIGCNSLDVSNYDNTNSKLPLKVFNLFGKEIENQKNQLFFQIYDDGSVDKRIIFK